MVSVNEASPPDTKVWLAGAKDTPMGAVQSVVIVTSTGRLLKPESMAAATWSGGAPGSSTPPVAVVIAVAWPVLSSPSPNPLLPVRQ